MRAKFLAIAVASLLLPGVASASSLLLEYSVTDTAAPGYHYDFTLTLTNADNSWVSGQQWDWIIFGDAMSSASPIGDFTNFASADPMASLTSTSGFHNGPTIEYGTSVLLPGWQPASVGSALSWSGDSLTLLGDGNLLWSTLVTSPGAWRANFETAQFVSAVPEPASWAMMLFGFGAIGFAMRRSTRRPQLQQA